MNSRSVVGSVASRLGRGARSLLSSAGQPSARSDFEALEPRILLSGDHPGIDAVFPDSGPPTGTPTEIVLTGGFGVGAGVIEDVPNDTGDFFRFTSSSGGFVSILAEALPVGAGLTDLNTAVEIYLPDGTELTGETDGLNNGILERAGLVSDGWFGFVADAGQEYFVRVIGENRDEIDAGAGEGGYSLQINNAVESLTLDSDGVARTGSDTGEAEVLSGGQQDRLYTFTTPNDASYNGLGYVLSGDVVFGNDADGYAAAGDADRDLVDTRVEVYDENGMLIASDSDAGYIWDAYAPVRFEADTTYYVRVRSDAIEFDTETDPQSGAQDDVNAGEFELRVQARATDVPLDGDTRVGVVDRASSGVTIADGFTPLSGPDDAGLLRDQHSAEVFVFEALGEGTAIASFFTYSVNPAPYTRFLDPKVTVYDDSGSLVPIDSNDTLIIGDGYDRAGLRFQVEAGARYFIVADVFDGQFLGTGVMVRDAASGDFDYRLAIEGPLTIDRTDDDQPVDDHIDFLTFENEDTGEVTILADQIRQLATPLVWGTPFQPVGFLGAGNYAADGDFVPPGVPGNMVGDVYINSTGGRAYSTFGRPDTGQGGFDQSLPDHSAVVQAFASGRLDGGGDTDVFQFVPQVDMLGTFEGGVDLLSGLEGEGDEPGQTWYFGGRPASRLTVNVFFEAEWFAFGGTAVQVYDSNFELVDEAQITPISSLNPDTAPANNLLNPSGLESPSLLPPIPTEGGNVDAPRSMAAVSLEPQYWGGEAYYLVVSAPQGQTRYTAVVQADAFDDSGTGFATDVEEPDIGEFGAAPELVLNPFTGVGTNFNNGESTAANRTMVVNSGRGEIDDDTGDFVPDDDFFNFISYTGELGMIHDRNDTDIFSFTAARDGTAEIVVGTTGLTDTFAELFALVPPGQVIETQNFSKTYNSPLDAALRVFDSTGNEIAFVDNFAGFGSGTVVPFGNGGAADLALFRKDPRVVIDVEEGQEYFVVVESSQRGVAASDVDWLVATGSYQLVVNTSPNAGGGDDHVDFPVGNFSGTVIPTNGIVGSGAATNTGTVSGTIEVDQDSDGFEYMAPAAGTVTVELQPESGLSLSLLILNGQGDIVPLVNSTALDGELLRTTFVAGQGERFRFLVGGIGGTGDYTLSLTGTPVTDDVADAGSFGTAGATPIVFGQFDRTVEVTGEIDDAADTDLFSFTAPVTDPITLTISGDNPSFGASVIVYEISSDPSLTSSPTQNSPIRTAVAWDLNADNDGTVQLRFSAQAGREYHVLVGGADPTTTTGTYNLGLTYTPEDDHADLGDLANATFINVVPETGLGSVQGVLEQINDTDLFVFGTPASGPVDVSLVWDAVTGASFELRIFDVNGNLLDPDGVAPQDTFTSSSGFLAIDGFDASPGEIFYVAVIGPTAVDIGYTLNVNTGLLDDHANEGDLANATVIPLDFGTGNGSELGRLEVDDDTDLFTFGVADGESVDVTISDTALGTPVLRVFDSTGALVSSSAIAGGVTFTNTTGEDGQFYVSVGSTFPGARSGVYTINVDGPPVPPPPGDDHANEGDLANATVLNVSSITGNASQGGVVNAVEGDPVVDTDLFRYTTTAAGPVFAQVSVAGRPAQDFTIRVFDASGNELTDLADSAGVAGTPGVTASTSFEAGAAGETYFFLVESTNSVDSGAYALNVDGVAATSVVYYPEGFANAAIHEFVSLANPNDVAVNYTITVYYADTSIAPAVVASGRLEADARGGATLSFGDGTYASGIVPNRAYSIVIESDLRIAAGLSHYDAGLVGRSDDRGAGAIGEAFTDHVSNEWLFPNVERNPGVVAQFLVYFNPNPFDVDVTITALTSAGDVVLPVGTLEANQRGGLEVHSTPALPLGTFAVRITSEATDPTNEVNNIGIVAATSYFDLIADTAYGYLGVGDGGSTQNVITSLTSGGGASAEINLFNPGTADTSVTIVGSYLTDSNLPDLRRTISLGAGRTTTLTGFDLAFVPGSPIGIEIFSDDAIAVSSVEVQRGDAAASAAVTQAGTSFYFGDAFINPVQAGTLYSESLTFYNPSSEDTNVSVTVFFADGTAQRTLSRMVEAQEFLRLDLENLPEIVGARPQLNFFSIRVEASTAIVSQLSHFDGVLGGGWLTTGAPLGLTNPIA